MACPYLIQQCSKWVLEAISPCSGSYHKQVVWLDYVIKRVTSALLLSARTAMWSSPVVLTESEFHRDAKNHLRITSWIMTSCLIHKNDVMSCSQKGCHIETVCRQYYSVNNHFTHVFLRQSYVVWRHLSMVAPLFHWKIARQIFEWVETAVTNLCSTDWLNFEYCLCTFRLR